MEDTDNNGDIIPFFVLHKASSQKPQKKHSTAGETQRRIDLSPSLPKSFENVGEENVDHSFLNLRMEAFQFVWSRIEWTIKDVLKEINTSVFNEIRQWVCDSFDAVRSCGIPPSAKATYPYPIARDASLKQIFTGLLLTNNMEIVDNLLIFEELGKYLKSEGCHVANLSSLDFSTKNGIGGCLRSLLRQFLMTTTDAADMSILASWYKEQEYYTNPVVLIVDDVERCCGSVLSDFILMLSEWFVKIPIMLIMGVATTPDALRNMLPSSTLQRLHPSKFTLGTPAERIDSIVKAVLVKPCSLFSIGHKVAAFMRNYFVRQDGTLTSFIKALEIACAQHFYIEPLSFILRDLSLEDDGKVLQIDKYGLSMEYIIKDASDFPSCQRKKMTIESCESLAYALSELGRSQFQWSTVVLCLYEAGKDDKIRLLDILCEVLDPGPYISNMSDSCAKSAKYSVLPPSSCQDYPRKGGVILQILHLVRDLSAGQLGKLLKKWEDLTLGIPEVYDKVKELQASLTHEDSRSSRHDMVDSPKRRGARVQLNLAEELKSLNENAAKLMEWMLRDYLQPIECMPFHEIVCFKNVDRLQLALIGDPRRTVQLDLLGFQKCIQCSCCSRIGNSLLPCMHDTSIVYNLAQEHGDLINLHDWYHTFKSIILHPTSRKYKFRQSPLPKKRKKTNESETLNEATIEARFCRAVVELQIAGLLRMPSKRRPDFIQRVAFGF